MKGRAALISALLLISCVKLISQEYQTSYWFDAGMTTDFYGLGEAMSLNLGLDDKFFSIEYEHYRFDGEYHSGRENIERRQISLLSGRSWALTENFRLGFLAGFGFGAYQYDELDNNGRSAKKQSLLLPVRLKADYSFSRNFGIYSRFNYGRLNPASGEWVPQLNVGVSLGFLPDYKRAEQEDRQTQQKPQGKIRYHMKVGAGYWHGKMVGNADLGLSQGLFFMRLRYLFLNSSSHTAQTTSTTEANILMLAPGFRLFDGFVNVDIFGQAGYGSFLEERSRTTSATLEVEIENILLGGVSGGGATVNLEFSDHFMCSLQYEFIFLQERSFHPVLAGVGVRL